MCPFIPYRGGVTNKAIWSHWAFQTFLQKGVTALPSFLPGTNKTDCMLNPCTTPVLSGGEQNHAAVRFIKADA